MQASDDELSPLEAVDNLVFELICQINDRVGQNREVAALFRTDGKVDVFTADAIEDDLNKFDKAITDRLELGGINISVRYQPNMFSWEYDAKIIAQHHIVDIYQIWFHSVGSSPQCWQKNTP